MQLRVFVNVTDQPLPATASQALPISERTLHTKPSSVGLAANLKRRVACVIYRQGMGVYSIDEFIQGNAGRENIANELIPVTMDLSTK